MKEKKVISSYNLPTQLPIWPTITWFLLMDRFNSPQWLWGMLGILFFIYWIACIGNISKEKQIDLLNKENDEQNESK